MLRVTVHFNDEDNDYTELQEAITNAGGVILTSVVMES